MQRFLTVLFSCVLPASLFLLVLPWLLYFVTPTFCHCLAFTSIFSCVIVEKLWVSFFRMRERHAPKIQKDWTTVTVSVSYISVMYAVIIEYYARKNGHVWVVATGAGVALYLAALAFRYWSLHFLGQQWAVHLDKMENGWQLITTGPYRYARHPLYLASCAEAVAISLIFGSYCALLLALFVYIPLQVQRAYFEEQFLHMAFGEDYHEYTRRTWALFPLPFGKK